MQLSKAEAYYANAGKWRAELAALRAVLRACPVTEDFKWRSPCYTFEGGNVAAVWGLKDDCAVAFFKGVLLKDPQNLLSAPGENSRSMRLIRFRSTAGIEGMEPILKDYIQAAIELEKAGVKVDLPEDDLDYPEELLQRFEEDPELQAAFAALTPGRQRGYLLHFAQAKQSRTRSARIGKHAPRILAGKGMHDR